MFFHHENPNEASNGFVKAVTLQRFSKFSNVKFSPLCVCMAALFFSQCCAGVLMLSVAKHFNDLHP